jgi:hypothetical protein
MREDTTNDSQWLQEESGIGGKERALVAMMAITPSGNLRLWGRWWGRECHNGPRFTEHAWIAASSVILSSPSPPICPVLTSSKPKHMSWESDVALLLRRTFIIMTDLQTPTPIPTPP